MPTTSRTTSSSFRACSSTRAAPGQGRLILRGVNTEGVASTVGVYMDETPFGSSSGLVNAAVLAGDFDTFDLDRIEVLRGPQGTFYGASSLSGVLKFVTAEPSTSGLEVRGRAGVEATDGGEASGYGNLVVNVPLSDIAAFRASGFYRSTGGFIDSIGDGRLRRRGEHQRQQVLRWPRVAAAHAERGHRPALHGGARRTSTPTRRRWSRAIPRRSRCSTAGYTLSQFVPTFSDLRYRVYNATGDFDLGFGTLTSSTSYATQKQDLQTDYTFALSPLIEAISASPTSSSRTSRRIRKSSPRNCGLRVNRARRLAGRRLLHRGRRA